MLIHRYSSVWPNLSNFILKIDFSLSSSLCVVYIDKRTNDIRRRVSSLQTYKVLRNVNHSLTCMYMFYEVIQMLLYLGGSMFMMFWHFVRYSNSSEFIDDLPLKNWPAYSYFSFHNFNTYKVLTHMEPIWLYYIHLIIFVLILIQWF